MSKETSLFRGLLVFGLVVPLALFLGYQLATPLQRTSLFWIALSLCLLLVPFMLRWHHELLVVTWNAALVAFFLPGSPAVGFLVAGMSLAISVVKRALSQRATFIRCPTISLPLLFLTAVVLFTAHEAGGLHANAFGSESWGAMRYFDVLGAIVGFFAFIGQPIPPRRAKLMAALFFLSGTTALLPVLISVAAPNTPSLLLPFSRTSSMVMETSSASGSFLERIVGLTGTAQPFLWFMLAWFGISGIFDWHRPWRLLCVGIAVVMGMFGGFRSFVILLFIVGCLQFYFEGLFRTRFFVVSLAAIILAGTFLVGFSDHLPLAVQRSLAFLPVNIDPVARQDARETLDWRLQAWQTVVRNDVPKYFFLGKGFNFDATDLYLTQLGMQRGIYNGYAWIFVSADYHNGILTLLVPFGIFGLLAFLAFCGASLRALYANYRYGSPELKKINTFLLALFLGNLIFYLVFYGSFYLDFATFTGAVAFSLALNGGVRQKAPAVMEATAVQLPRESTLQPV